MIDRTQEQASAPAEAESQSGMTFGFAKIWERQQEHPNGALAEYNAEPVAEEGDADFWAQVLEQSKKEEEARAERIQSGRGVRRKATKTVRNLSIY